MLHLVLLVFAFVLFAVSALPPAAPQWNRLISAGLAFLVASIIQW